MKLLAFASLFSAALAVLTKLNRAGEKVVVDADQVTFQTCSEVDFSLLGPEDNKAMNMVVLTAMSVKQVEAGLESLKKYQDNETVTDMRHSLNRRLSPQFIPIIPCFFGRPSGRW